MLVVREFPNQLKGNYTVKAEHKKVGVTYAQDAKACGAKRYIVNGDGGLKKHAFGTSQGKMIVCEVTLDGPTSITSPHVYAICSVPKDKPVIRPAILTP